LDIVHKDQGGIDLLLTDLVMPQMNGLELARSVLGRHPGIPVLYMSGYSAGVIEQQGAVDPALLLLHKPFGAPELLEQVWQGLESHARDPDSGTASQR
jgi:hypothetical protein